MADVNDLDFAINCTTAAALYNTLYDELYDPAPFLQSLVRPSVNVSADTLGAWIQDAKFTQECINQIGTVCRETVCSSLRFPGNADIAGIGVRSSIATQSD